MLQHLFTPFRVVISFILIAIISYFTLPNLIVDLLPQEKSNELQIIFSMPRSNPHVIEQQVTSIIEGACSKISQLTKIYSVSDYNNGYVKLVFDKTADIQYKQLEVSEILRQVHSKLPVTTSYPIIVRGENKNVTLNELLVYSINAPLQTYSIKQKCEDIFNKALAGVDGIKETKVSGTHNFQLSIQFDKNKCHIQHLSTFELINSLQDYFKPSWPGNIVNVNGGYYFLHVKVPKASINNIENILLPVLNKGLIRIKDIANVFIEEQIPQTYFRVNGENAVNLSIYSREGENRIEISKKVKKIIDNLKTQLPNNFDIKLEYDDTIFLKNEINKNYYRALFSVIILLLFTLISYRNFRYLIILFSSLFLSICFTIIFSYVLNINIHLYTLAGIAISFGLIMDNAIVMLDYYERTQNRKIFHSILAANLVSIISVSLVYFLPNAEKNNLIDFSSIVVLALISSLITVFGFIPEFYKVITKFKLNKNFTSSSNILKYFKIRQLIKINSVYYTFIKTIAKNRKLFIIILTISFGIPLFLLPQKLEEGHWYTKLYNYTFGSETYIENIKPVTDIYTGGVFRLFFNNIYEKSSYRSPSKTKLYVNAELPFGNSASQLNYILTNFEKYLSTIDGIDKYVTNIYSGQNATIEITFKSFIENTNFPYLLKSKLISKSIENGGIKWNIYGVGQGFSNPRNVEIGNFKIIIKGYNYDELEKQAMTFQKLLNSNKRIHNININENIGIYEKNNKEYLLNLDLQKLALHKTNTSNLLNKINELSQPIITSSQILLGNNFYPVVVKEKDVENFSDFKLLHEPIKLNSNKVVKINKIGNLKLSYIANSIHRENRQYIRIVSLNYLGSFEEGYIFIGNVLNDLKTKMPIGYTATCENIWFQNKSNRGYQLIGILFLCIFFLCSILFEDIKKSFVVLLVIPVSFLGLFLIFTFGDFYFDQGGYAAFIMLIGLSANSAIFIINDFLIKNNKKSKSIYNKFLIKTITFRARTILLTLSSTICGLIPYLIEGQNEIFWFSLAVGTIGGIIFTIFSTLVVLPVLLWRIPKKIPTLRN